MTKAIFTTSELIEMFCKKTREIMDKYGFEEENAKSIVKASMRDAAAAIKEMDKFELIA